MTDTTKAQSQDATTLIADLAAYFDHEVTLMQGNFGLVGDESFEDLEDESDAPALEELKTAIDLRERLTSVLGATPAAD